MKPLSSSGNVSSQVCGYKNRISLPDRDFFLTLFFVPDVASINHKLRQIKDNKTATCYMPQMRYLGVDKVCNVARMWRIVYLKWFQDALYLKSTKDSDTYSTLSDVNVSSSRFFICRKFTFVPNMTYQVLTKCFLAAFHIRRWRRWRWLTSGDFHPFLSQQNRGFFKRDLHSFPVVFVVTKTDYLSQKVGPPPYVIVAKWVF